MDRHEKIKKLGEANHDFPISHLPAQPSKESKPIPKREREREIKAVKMGCSRHGEAFLLNYEWKRRHHVALRVNPAISTEEPYKFTATYSMPWIHLIGRQSIHKSQLDVGRIFCPNRFSDQPLSLFFAGKW